MTHFEQVNREADRPAIEQLMEYRDLLVEIVRGQGRGIRYARSNEAARTRTGTEYFLPGSVSEWSIPDIKSKTHLLRERRFSASFRRIGADAGRLLVLESDSVRTERATYDTRRNIYRFTWGDTVGLYESEVLPIQIVSSVQADAEVLSIEPLGIKDVLSLDVENTADTTDGNYHCYVNPFRETESPWAAVEAADLDLLTIRTDEFGRELLLDK